MARVYRDFNYNGGWQKWKVPNNVTKVEVTLTGGGSRSTEGGKVVGEIRVKDTDELWFFLGRKGHQTGSHQGGGAAEGGGGPGGDGGHPSRVGGDSGGGGSVIRLNSPQGKIVAVAGGAGGRSGDGGTGGAGGGKAGNKGNRADASGDRATGGTQNKGGNKGTVAGHGNFDGENAKDGTLDRGGRGGQVGNNKAYGGGGGGGGWRAGGGGQAGKSGGWYGGGGGGGSSYVEEMFNVTTNNSNGGTEHGSLRVEWQEGGDYPPSPPTAVKINDVAVTDEMVLHSYSAVVTGKPDDPTKNQDVRMVLFLSDVGPISDVLMGHNGTGIQAMNGPYQRYQGTWDEQNKIDRITINGLLGERLYHGRLYSQDKRGQMSTSYVGLKFWCNRKPDAPVPTMPAENTDFESDENIEFDWTNSDPDTDGGHPETPTHWAFRWRQAPTATDAGSPWVTGTTAGNPTSVIVPASSFPPGAMYEWQVAVKDPLGLWSDWSAPAHFQVTAAAVAPDPGNPRDGEARIFNEIIRFTWQFRTLVSGETQTTVDLRYRVYGSQDDGDWETILGDLVEPGDDQYLDVAAETFTPGVHYEWQVRAHTTSATTSDWSISRDFWAAFVPGTAAENEVPFDLARPQGSLGQGVNRVYAYARGGQIYLGEIGPFAQVVWGRSRDGLSSCKVIIHEWTEDQKAFYQTLKSWATELVVFRDGVRCWEGPITHRSSNKHRFTIEAKDPMAYVYRRILRQGYNDSYQINAGQQVGLNTVVWRSRQIILNALVYDDPNVLAYLTTLQYHDDAIQSRVVKSYTKTAWEDIDDLAANAGLDYTTIGRRIILNDTHRPIGRLPEMGDGDFSDPPEVTEYGMSYATDFAVTNNNGIYGLATRRTGDNFTQTGYIEQLASEYGESDIAGVGTETMTPEQIAQLQATLTAQAERNIAARYPIPVVVRIPDNSTLSPEVNLGINQIVPGAWVPLRVTEGIIEASQWQKIDSMTVTQDDKGEKISVVMSPAPNGGVDPDAIAELEDF